MEEEKEKLKINFGTLSPKRNFINAAIEAGAPRYSPNKWRAIEMYTESSVNMIVLMCNYVAQSAMTDMHGAIYSDKKLYKHMIKVHTRDAKDKIDACIEKCIMKNRDDAQVNYLFTYSDFMDSRMRPRVKRIKEELERILVLRGCKKANACAWVLTCEGLVRMSCKIFICVMSEIKEMFRCDMSSKFLDYYIIDCYDELKFLIIELERLYPEMKGIDSQNTPETSKIFEEIDDDIRYSNGLEEAADEANAGFTEERRQQNSIRVQKILDEIGDTLDEHKDKYGKRETQI